MRTRYIDTQIIRLGPYDNVGECLILKIAQFDTALATRLWKYTHVHTLEDIYVVDATQQDAAHNVQFS